MPVHLFPPSVAVLRAAAVVLACALEWLPAAASGLDPLDARFRELEIERDLWATENRLDSMPSRSAFDLDRTARELRRSGIETVPGAGALRIERRIRDLRSRAERIRADRQLKDARRPDDALKKGLAEPPYLRRPYDTDLAGRELPVGTGKAFILIQNALRRSDEGLRSGDVHGAARLLAGAAADLERLKARVGPIVGHDEPNLLALESQLGALKDRLEDKRNEG